MIILKNNEISSGILKHMVEICLDKCLPVTAQVEQNRILDKLINAEIDIVDGGREDLTVNARLCNIFDYLGLPDKMRNEVLIAFYKYCGTFRLRNLERDYSKTNYFKNVMTKVVSAKYRSGAKKRSHGNIKSCLTRHFEAFSKHVFDYSSSGIYDAETNNIVGYLRRSFENHYYVKHMSDIFADLDRKGTRISGDGGEMDITDYVLGDTSDKLDIPDINLEQYVEPILKVSYLLYSQQNLEKPFYDLVSRRKRQLLRDKFQFIQKEMTNYFGTSAWFLSLNCFRDSTLHDGFTELAPYTFSKIESREAVLKKLDSYFALSKVPMGHYRRIYIELKKLDDKKGKDDKMIFKFKQNVGPFGSVSEEDTFYSLMAGYNALFELEHILAKTQTSLFSLPSDIFRDVQIFNRFDSLRDYLKDIEVTRELMRKAQELGSACECYQKYSPTYLQGTSNDDLVTILKPSSIRLDQYSLADIEKWIGEYRDGRSDSYVSPEPLVKDNKTKRILNNKLLGLNEARGMYAQLYSRIIRFFIHINDVTGEEIFSFIKCKAETLNMDVDEEVVSASHKLHSEVQLKLGERQPTVYALSNVNYTKFEACKKIIEEEFESESSVFKNLVTSLIMGLDDESFADNIKTLGAMYIDSCDFSDVINTGDAEYHRPYLGFENGCKIYKYFDNNATGEDVARYYNHIKISLDNFINEFDEDNGNIDLRAKLVNTLNFDDDFYLDDYFKLDNFYPVPTLFETGETVLRERQTYFYSNRSSIHSEKLINLKENFTVFDLPDILLQASIGMYIADTLMSLIVNYTDSVRDKKDIYHPNEELFERFYNLRCDRRYFQAGSKAKFCYASTEETALLYMLLKNKVVMLNKDIDMRKDVLSLLLNSNRLQVRWLAPRLDDIKKSSLVDEYLSILNLPIFKDTSEIFGKMLAVSKKKLKKSFASEGFGNLSIDDYLMEMNIVLQDRNDMSEQIVEVTRDRELYLGAYFMDKGCLKVIVRRGKSYVIHVRGYIVLIDLNDITNNKSDCLKAIQVYSSNSGE